jgi:hypothetical protein
MTMLSFRWYNYYKFNDDNVIFYNNNHMIKEFINNIEYICSKSSYILTLEKFYNSVDNKNRNILHYIYIHKLDNTYLYHYMNDNKLSSEFYIDIYGKRPIDYKK